MNDQASDPLQLTPHFHAREWEGSDGPYPVGNIDADTGDGRTWLETRLLPLARVLEAIREETGAPITITPHGGYRSEAHQQRMVDSSPDAVAAGDIAGAKTSQHPKGRAADIQSAKLSAEQLHARILKMFSDGKLPMLGGLGKYASFVHVDVRPRVGGHLAQWGGARTSNVA